jgi:hypothetical protein
LILIPTPLVKLVRLLLTLRGAICFEFSFPFCEFESDFTCRPWICFALLTPILKEAALPLI